MYESETGFYYLGSRYYDPEIGRFLNADVYISTGTGILGYNMFAYCGNNPIMYVDELGCHQVKIDNKESLGDALEGLDQENINRVKGTNNTSSNNVTHVETTVSESYDNAVTLLDGGTKIGMALVKHATETEPRPNKIGVGTYKKMVTAQLDDISKVSKNLDNAFKGMDI